MAACPPTRRPGTTTGESRTRPGRWAATSPSTRPRSTVRTTSTGSTTSWPTKRSSRSTTRPAACPACTRSASADADPGPTVRFDGSETPMPLAQVFETFVGPDAPVEFVAYDGSRAGAEGSPVRLTVRAPAAVAYLAQAP